MTEFAPTTAAGIQPNPPHAAAQAGIQEWHGIVAALDWDRLPDLLAEDVVFRNPAAIESYHGKAQALGFPLDTLRAACATAHGARAYAGYCKSSGGTNQNRK